MISKASVMLLCQCIHDTSELCKCTQFCFLCYGKTGIVDAFDW